jgi:PASTA domain
MIFFSASRATTVRNPLCFDLAGSPVNLVISSGPETVVVPNVEGLTQDAATAAITAAKLTVGTVTQQTSDTLAPGKVISQDPASGGSETADSRSSGEKILPEFHHEDAGFLSAKGYHEFISFSNSRIGLRFVSQDRLTPL